MSLSEALKVAEEAGVDLIEISPNADPPVAKVLDWGKYQYQKIKELQKNRKHSKAAELKQMRMGLKIGANDLDIKLRKIREFLHDGHKVKILLFFRGREIAHQDLGYELIEKNLVLARTRCNIRAKANDGWTKSEYSSKE
jgi:translation initiation factor IF-3